MKNMKRIASVLLTLVMLAALAIPAMAAGETGSITINDAANVSVAGKTFNAYKILDLKMVGTDGYVYTVPAAMKAFYLGRYTDLTGNEGDFDAKVVAKIKAETDLFAFAADALAAAKAANITPGTATAPDGAKSVTINDLPLGYYVVEDAGAATPISALILDTTNPNPSVTIKADKPSIDKNIDGTKDTDDATTGDVKYNNAAVGDEVPYKVTSKVPDMTGYTKYYFVVNDTLSKGLTFNDDVVIKIGSTALTKCSHASEAAHTSCYTVTSTKNADGTTSVEIVLKNFIQYKDQVGDPITITYSATVNKDAVIGVAGNPNEVKLTYSNNPNVKDDGTPGNPDKPTDKSPTGKTPESVTRTYVTDIEIIKVDPAGNRLTGAEFKLEGTKLNTVLVRTDVYTEAEDGAYWKLKDGSYTTDDPNTEGMDKNKYESTTIKYSKTVETKEIVKAENVTYTGTVGADGVLRFEGLSAGEYTITEIKAPAGYNLLKDSITVTIGFTAPTAPSTDCTWAYTWNSGEQNGNNVTTNNSNTVTVINEAGIELPSTGGMGTTIFYVVGSILVVGAAVLLITKKRMGAEG